MKLSTSNKTKLTATIALILLTTSALMVMLNAPVQAQLAAEQPYSGALKPGDVADFTVDTDAYISIRPATIGLNQLILVNTWLIPAPHANRLFKDLKVTITKPSGQLPPVIMDSYPADGTSWFEWIADEVGTWTFKYEFPGMYFPAGRYMNGDIITGPPIFRVTSDYAESVYYRPSSTPEMTIEVVEDLVLSWPDLGLPTDYWTRPVPYEHREWAPVAGNYPWHGPGGGAKWDELYPDTNPRWGGTYSAAGAAPGFFGAARGTWTPWVDAPDSGHVAWKKPYTIAGIIGGDYGVEITNTGIFSSAGAGGFPAIIYAGRAYEASDKPGSGQTAQSYWMCYDIRTGEMIWERPTRVR
jgi:hypothetical protein